MNSLGWTACHVTGVSNDETTLDGFRALPAFTTATVTALPYSTKPPRPRIPTSVGFSVSVTLGAILLRSDVFCDPVKLGASIQD